MDRVVHCECGFDARAEYEDALVAEVQRHAREAHGMALSYDEALLLAFRAELAENAAHHLSDDDRSKQIGGDVRSEGTGARDNTSEGKETP